MNTVKLLKKVPKEGDIILNVGINFDYLDETCGKERKYPEYDPLIRVYLSRDISPVQTHVIADTREASKSDKNRKMSEGISLQSITARTQPGLRSAKDNLSSASLCFSVMARTKLHDFSSTGKSCFYGDRILSPIGYGSICIKDILKTTGISGNHKVGRVEVEIKDPVNMGEVKGIVFFNRISIQADGDTIKRIMKKRDRSVCAGFYSKESSTSIDRMVDEFFQTFRSNLTPSDPGINIYQVPFFSASSAAVPSACFLMYQPSDMAFGVNSNQLNHLIACIEASLSFNNITSDFFCGAVEKQIDGSAAVVYDSFLVAVKAACNALCFFAVRVKYTEDHADPQRFSIPVQKTTETSVRVTSRSPSRDIGEKSGISGQASCRHRYNRFRNPKKSRCYQSASTHKGKNGDNLLYFFYTITFPTLLHPPPHIHTCPRPMSYILPHLQSFHLSSPSISVLIANFPLSPYNRFSISTDGLP